jgi:RNA recognition motif-containing protein
MRSNYPPYYNPNAPPAPPTIPGAYHSHHSPYSTPHLSQSTHITHASSHISHLSPYYHSHPTGAPGSDPFEYHFETVRTVFMGDLSYFCTEDDLYAIGSPYGHITAIKVRRGNQGKSLLFGFVEYETIESAQHAFHKLNNRLFMGRYLR